MGLGMLPELHDEIGHLASGQDYPAYVFTRQSAGQAIEGDTGGSQGSIFIGFSLASTLQALVEPGGPWRVNDDVTWNGSSYIVSNVALRRDIDGEDHHITLTLDRPA